MVTYHRHYPRHAHNQVVKMAGTKLRGLVFRTVGNSDSDVRSVSAELVIIEDVFQDLKFCTKSWLQLM